jgi:hypothetical protein
MADDFAKRAAIHDEEGSFPFENYERLKESGYTRLIIPESLGGLGATMLERLFRDVRAGLYHPFDSDETLEFLGKRAFGIPLFDGLEPV